MQGTLLVLCTFLNLTRGQFSSPEGLTTTLTTIGEGVGEAGTIAPDVRPRAARDVCTGSGEGAIVVEGDVHGST